MFQLKNDIKNLREDEEKSKDYIAKLEVQIDYLQIEQNKVSSRWIYKDCLNKQDIRDVEEKISTFSEEVIRLQEENSRLRSLQDELKRELLTTVSEKDQQKKEYKHIKMVNRGLEREIREVFNF